VTVTNLGTLNDGYESDLKIGGFVNGIVSVPTLSTLYILPTGTIAGSITNGKALFDVGLIDGTVSLQPGAYLNVYAGGSVGSTGTPVFASSATVIDAGTIGAGNGVPIAFGGTGGNLLVLEHGYELAGNVSVAGTNNTLELLRGDGVVSVGFGAHGFGAFDTVEFGAPGADQETLAVGATAGTLAATIADFNAAADTIDLTAIGADATLTHYDPVTHQATLAGSGGSVTLQFDGPICVPRRMAGPASIWKSCRPLRRCW
jgi:hypothetical protein